MAKNTTAGHQTIHVEQTKGYFYSFGTKAREAGKSINAICQLEQREVIPAKFSVSATKQVYFSVGNLWADASKKLHFEIDQQTTSPAWSTSHVRYFTWSGSINYAVGTNTDSQTYLFCDENHKVAVNGSAAIYYNLTVSQWQYLIKSRGDNKVKWATVAGKTGIVVAPDNVTLDSSKSSYTEAELDDLNLLFLPNTGYRETDNRIEWQSAGHYWTSTAGKRFMPTSEEPDKFLDAAGYRGCCIRLVTDAPTN